VGILLTPNIGNPIEARESEAAARALKLQPYFDEVHAPGDIERAIAGLAKSRVGAIYMSGSTMLASHAARVAAIVAKNRIPAVYANERFVDAGGLMVYSGSTKKNFVRVADYVDRILKGARAGDLPIEQTSDVELVINLKTAKALGIKIPQSILQRADRAID